VENLEAKVVLGDASPHEESLKSVFSKMPSGFQLIRGVSDMASLMAGPTWPFRRQGALPGRWPSWSPECGSGPVDNQGAVALELEREGCSILMGHWSTLEPEALARTIRDLCYDRARRTSMSLRGRALVDGMGADRVIEEMLSCSPDPRGRCHEDPCIAAHPDDEVLGCWRNPRKAQRSGDEAMIVILGEGIMARAGEAEREAFPPKRIPFARIPARRRRFWGQGRGPFRLPR